MGVPRRRQNTISGSARLSALIGACVVAGCSVGGCGAGAAAPGSGMTVTVSAVTDRPVTVYVDTHQQGASGFAGRSSGPTPVELSPARPTAVVPVPYDSGDWLRARVAGPPDRPASITVGCELRAGNGRFLAADATSPSDPATEDASCAGAD